MSHWSLGKTKIKDINLFKEVAKRLGTKVVEADSMTSTYAGKINCAFLLRHKNGEAAIVKEGNDNYKVQMDNYYNPIVDKIGPNGDLLCREYMVEKTRQEAAMMGGVVSSTEVNSDGSVDLLIEVM